MLHSRTKYNGNKIKTKEVTIHNLEIHSIKKYQQSSERQRLIKICISIHIDEVTTEIKPLK